MLGRLSWGVGFLAFLAFSWASAGQVGAAGSSTADSFAIVGEEEIPVEILHSRMGVGLSRSTSPEWKVLRSISSGRVRMLRGPGTQSYGADPGAAAISFLSDVKGILGLGQQDEVEVRDVVELEGKRHVRLRQSFRGVPVEGADLLVHMTPEGSVTMLQNNSVPDLTPTNQRSVTRDEAIGAAMARLRLSLGSEAVLGEPSGELIIARFDGRHKYSWKVKVPTLRPAGNWITYLDADTGQVLKQYNAVISARLGKKGQGYVYRTNADAASGNYRRTGLNNLLSNAKVKSLDEDWIGHLAGWFIFVGTSTWDPSLAYAKNGKFLFDPINFPAEFAEVNAYYHFNLAHDWWRDLVEKGLKVQYLNDRMIPSAGVNASMPGDCNAYYMGGGAFLFSDEGDCLDVPGLLWDNPDFSLDSGVIYHEYAHMMHDSLGFPFDSDLDHYPRAMAEGDADYWSCMMRNSPLMGEILDDGTHIDLPRDLSGAARGQRLYPDDVDDPATGFPEEHYTGEIWGQFLWDLKDVLQSRANRHIYLTNRSYLLNSGGHHTDDIDFADWARAFLSMSLDKTGSDDLFFSCYPVFADRGIFTREPYCNATRYFGVVIPVGDPPLCDNIDAIARIFKKAGTWTNSGNLRVSTNPSEYVFRLDFGATQLVVNITAASGELLEPRVQLRDFDAAGAVYTPDDQDLNDNSAHYVFTGLPTGTLLVAEVFSDAADTGRYTLAIQAN